MTSLSASSRAMHGQGARVSPDRLWVGIAAIALVTVVMLASMAFSFQALTMVAEWSGNASWTYPLAAIFIDGSILTFTLSMVVFRWRGQDSRRTLAILITFTVLSCALNVIHAGADWHWDFSLIQAWGGMIISGAAPIAALLSAEEVTRLAFMPPDFEPAVVTEEAVPAVIVDDAIPVVHVEHPVLEIPPHRVARPRPLLTFQTES